MYVTGTLPRAISSYIEIVSTSKPVRNIGNHITGYPRSVQTVTRTSCGMREVLITVKTVFIAFDVGCWQSTSKYGRSSVAAAYVPTSQLALLAVTTCTCAADAVREKSRIAS